MSRTHAKRLVRAASRLSPLQVVLAMLADMHRHESIFEYCRSLPDYISPADTISGQIQASVGARMKGKEKQDHGRALRSATREGVFLARLACACEMHTLEALDRLGLLRLVLRSQGQYLWLRFEHGEDGPAIREELDLAVAFAARLRRHLQALAAAVELIEREYFAGRVVLFSATRARLQEATDEMVEMEGTLAGRGAGRGQGSELRRGRGRSSPGQAAAGHGAVARADQSAVEIAARVIAGAKAETLAAAGDNRRAAEVMRPYLG